MDRVVVRNRDLKDPTAPWACLGNYFPREFIVQGVPYLDVERYYQSEKVTSAEDKKKILEAHSPSRAKKIGDAITEGIVEDWEEKKVEVMKRGLMAKFYQHQDLKAQLKATQQAEIIFETSRDDFWGMNKEGEGENRLGLLLMEIRGAFMLDDIRAAMGQGGGISFNV